MRKDRKRQGKIERAEMESINAGGEIERETWKQSKGLDV